MEDISRKDLGHGNAFAPLDQTYLQPLAMDLIKFSRNSVSALGGFGYLDALGNVDASKPRQVYVQCRMIQVLGLAELFNLASSRTLIEDGVDAILDIFQDKVHGGFFNSIDSQGRPMSDEKLAYDHAFVLLAGVTAKALGIARADGFPPASADTAAPRTQSHRWPNRASDPRS